MSLDLIIGPMFSGKTTELLRRLYTLSSINKKCIYINSQLDDREDANFSSHNPSITTINVDSMKVNKFDDKLLNTISNYDVIGIDPDTENEITESIQAGIYGRPSFYTSSYDEYTHSEILTLLNTDAWNDPEADN